MCVLFVKSKEYGIKKAAFESSFHYIYMNTILVLVKIF
ncbi:hypothetical protein M2459_003207 [Parabacteroides sp. PF5-5]|nr:hypothetical protein [Parabacteroides sp. PH5-39]MDH6317504.1 hypothetical protein [Parabacteroides sp. PF5-13]MDH6321193.1 hypothetical protein [Parabacteroides sp. PH5-13]MDH6324925.1 hypothetical protein [Parabacteroides sp. PH5-8]MDH6328634.1 hypothetical protein [Parabacteroides sp. PH5-41]MDH6336436.1 hypothetical protein [Parabacteroides sp. PF5-5]MDH6347500.1 hypothetical protein [Parabacteroides sp. PH5-46]MDH6362462.1 hypothetical protein [Parabacteroides sp. PH5-16]MDH6378130.